MSKRALSHENIKAVADYLKDKVYPAFFQSNKSIRSSKKNFRKRAKRFFLDAEGLCLYNYSRETYILSFKHC